MSEIEQQDQQEATGGRSGFQMELLLSYLSFARGALRRRIVTCFAVFGVGLALTVLAFVYLPRTFLCSTVLAATGNPILDARDTPSALTGAEESILGHENLEAIIREQKLADKAEQRRPPLLKLKDRIMRGLVGEQNDKIKIAALVGTLETRLSVKLDRALLTIKSEWTDAVTAAELAEAARERFVRARRTSEMSAFEEKMTILQGHITHSQEEISALYQKSKEEKQDAASQARQRQQELLKEANSARLATLPRPARRSPVTDGSLPELNERLATARRKLQEDETDRKRRLQDEEAKLADLKVKFTASHPSVMMQEQRVAAVAQIPGELALLRAEVKDLEAEIEQRKVLQDGARIMAGRPPLSAGSAALLPADVLDVLDKEDTNPVLSSQLTSAVVRFSRLHEEMANARVQLDLADAAFKRRYQIVVPAEVPLKPTKPKPGLIFGVGLALSLILALAIPLLLELRRGTFVENWQVHHLQLPVLAEVTLPPYSAD